MSEQRPQSWLERALGEEAERAIADDLDLWPGVSQRLRKRGAAGSPRQTTNGVVDVRDLGTVRGEMHPLPFAAHTRRRSGEFVGAAITVGLAALVIAVFALIVGRPGTDREQVGFGGDSDPALAETAPVLVAGPECTFDLDVSLESGMDGVEVRVWARSNLACADTGTLRLAVIDAPGERAAISGNPLTLPLTAEGRERRADATAAWSNWCGERGQFQIETSFGDEQRTHALPEAPRCVDRKRPSTLRMSAAGASATPEMPATQGTPIP